MNRDTQKSLIPLLSGMALFLVGAFFLKFLLIAVTIFFISYYILRFVILKEEMKLDTPTSTMLTFISIMMKILSRGVGFLLEVLSFTKTSILFVLKNREQIKSEMNLIKK